MKETNQNILQAYKSALDFAKVHYENFPVVSLLIPQNLRRHIAIIYWFARTADDLADEGESNEVERLNKLNTLEKSLTDLNQGKFNSPFEEALRSTILSKRLSVQLFYNLLTAFKQDVVKKRYQNFEELLIYCSHSANPIGRLILELFDIRDEDAFRYSDKICTALQLTNFLQDLESDYERGRIYLPADEMKSFNVSEIMFANKENNVNLKRLLKYNVERIQVFFDEGTKLLNFLDGRLKYEIKWTILGGREVLNKLKKLDYCIFNSRPKLNFWNYSILFVKAFLFR